MAGWEMWRTPRRNGGNLPDGRLGKRRREVGKSRSLTHVYLGLDSDPFPLVYDPSDHDIYVVTEPYSLTLGKLRVHSLRDPLSFSMRGAREWPAVGAAIAVLLLMCVGNAIGNPLLFQQLVRSFGHLIESCLN